MSTVAVIGGGAAGMMAAIAAAQNGHTVCLYEKNEKLGKKLFITGKGRCNLTNNSSVEELLEAVCENRRFLYSAFYGFDSQSTIRFFEDEGMPVKTERGQRVFPQSDHSSDVIAVLARVLKRYGVKICLNQEVKDILTGTDTDEKRYACGLRLSSGREVCADAVIIATGGLSYPSTGSTGDGYRFAAETGHQVIGCSPSLVPIETREDWAPRMQGLSLRNVKVTVCDGKKELFSDFGEMMFTHYGVTGPLILSASCLIQKRLRQHPLTLKIDLKPALGREQLDRRILREFQAAQNKQFKTVLGTLFPAKMIPVIADRTEIPCDCPIHEITRAQRERLLQITKCFSLTLTHLRDYNEAIITRGGVSVKDVNPTTMESKKVNGLYFAGEVLDVDALTGGYNLQIAWSTGHAAGASV
ncbi:MAG: NAD(P)/FAD-dependent oxidoreductase [Lachnospiraceae bacterium]|nr:NAD(P)/FAD-dependent oxidoreductase [Lachnospiraceae bacterium]